MSRETAKQSVEFMLKEAGDNKVAHLTFFGGETLMNFPVLKSTIAYARQRGAEVGKDVDFSLTTNATLLRPEVIEFLVENEVGVTISFDGPPEVQDKFRVFHNGTGSYDIVAPKIKALLSRHRTRPVGARVTLTAGNLDVREDLRASHPGVRVPRSRIRTGDDVVQTRVRDRRAGLRLHAGAVHLARRGLQGGSDRRPSHGFSNVQGNDRGNPQGDEQGVSLRRRHRPDGRVDRGDVALCHRFAGSDDHKLGTVADGIDRAVQAEFLDKHHLDNKTDCSTCWARPVCSGGCYHEAHTRYGDTTKAEPALLRLDSRMDRRLPEGVCRDCRTQSGLAGAIQP